MPETRFLYTSFDAHGPRQSDALSSTDSNLSIEELAPTPGNTSSATTPGVPALLRRLHTKSRRGCLNCKRRRVKCPENHPACTQCTKRGLSCEWPPIQIQQSQAGRGQLERYTGGPRQSSINVPAPHAGFTMQDFRLFNHFKADAHPFHPIGNEEKWTHDVPSIAHNYDFLLHSMLALAASDLASRPHKSLCSSATTSAGSPPSSSLSIALTPDQRSLTAAALNHRVLAIKSLQNALAKGVHDMEAGNAMLATCYVLVFQSSLISDGFPEFMSFIRGCMVVAFQMGSKRMKFIFENIAPDDQLKILGPNLETDPGIPRHITDAVISSLQFWEHLIVRDSERHFFDALMEIIVQAQHSSRGAYLGIMRVYGIFAYSMSAHDFTTLIDPSNIVGLLLQAHLVAMQTILEPVLHAEQKASEDNKLSKAGPKHMGSMHWLDSIHAKAGKEWEPYFAWTKCRAEELRKMIWSEIEEGPCEKCEKVRGDGERQGHEQRQFGAWTI